MGQLLRNNRSNFQAGYEGMVRNDYKCSECGKREGYFNYNSQTCSAECARKRKTRLQKERRHASKSRGVTVKFKAHHSGA